CSLGMTPVRTRDVAPPLKVIIQRNGSLWRSKDHRAGHKVFRWGPGIFIRTGDSFSDRHVAGRGYKTLKVFIRDFSRVHKEAIDPHAMDGPRISKHREIASHPKLATGYPHHPVRRGMK